MRLQVTPDERKRMLQLYKQKLSYDTIGRRMNRSGRTVSRIVQKELEAEAAAEKVSGG